LLGGEPFEDVVESERVVSQLRRVRVHVRERGLGRFVVVFDRSTLSVPGDVPVPDLDLHDLHLGLGSASDRERLLELQRDDPGVDFHAGRLGRQTRP